MSVKEAEPGKWLVQIDRKGIPRVRKSFSVKSDAVQFERDYLEKYLRPVNENKDLRTMRELIEIWYRYHGMNLAAIDKFKRKMIRAADEMGNPIASEITPAMIVDYRYKRMVTDDDAITATTFNNLHAYLASVFSRLKRLKVIDYDNPFAQVERIRVHEKQMSYLSKDQITMLLEEVKNCPNPCVWYVVNLCLRTGARWNEACQLKRKQLHHGRVTFEFTKSKKTRSIPLDESFYKVLMEFAKYKQPEERLFNDCYTGYRTAIKRAGIELPKGQLSHVLRHSFASHFMMSNGNILTLQKIMGHADIRHTLRYAHLAPNHLDDAKKLNPLAD